jgi:3-mercaptopyruvate sulfurtransferase SseA
LKYFGHEKFQILDGGIKAWESKFDLSTETVEVTKSQYRAAKTNDQIFAQMKLVKERLDDPNTRLIDGRPPEQFSGKTAGRVFHTQKEHPRKGHVPGAVSWRTAATESISQRCSSRWSSKDRRICKVTPIHHRTGE